MLKSDSLFKALNRKTSIISGIYLSLLAVLLALLPLSVFVLMRHIADNERDLRFVSEATRLRGTVEQHVEVLEESIYATQALFEASQSVERNEWMAFTERLRLKETRPGFIQMRFLRRVPRADVEALEKKVRDDRSVNAEGYPGFKVFPPTERAESLPVEFTNPGDGDLEIMGFDVGSLPERRSLYREAARSGRILSTPAVRWMGRADGRWVVILTGPVYVNGADLSSPDAREQNLMGFVDIVVDVQAHFNKIFGQTRYLKDRIYCQVQIQGDAGTEPMPVYDSRPLTAPGLDHTNRFYRQLTVHAAGRLWRLNFFAPSDFDATPVRMLFPALAGVAGLLVSSLVFWIILLSRSAQAKAYGLARQMTRDLERSRDRLLLAQEAGNFGSWDWNLLTQESVWTEEEYALYGLTPGKSVPYEVWEALVHPDDLSAVKNAIKRSIDTLQPYFSEFRIRSLQGHERWISARGRIYADESGKPVRMVGVDMDVTERKKLEAQLLQKQKMETVGTLAGGIAHDLNNQLSPLLGYVDLILTQTPPGNPNREMLEEAKIAGQRCADIVKRLLHFSRPSTQKKEPVPLDKVLSDTRAVLKKFLPATIQMEYRVPSPLGSVLASETELQSVFMNLAANARDAMPNGGLIIVEARTIHIDAASAPKDHQPGAYAVCSFRDSGTGMTPEVMARIFEPFFSTKERGKGTGLGLAMVFSIVKDHGGWIDVSSRVGEGTVFQIYLPLAQEKIPGHFVSAPADLPQLAKGSGRVLFADDEEYMRNLGRVFLERLGYGADLAANGIEAVERFRKSPAAYCAVVLDMTMPGQTGVQTIRQILGINPQAKILVASGHTTEGTPEELAREGVREFLPKPYTIQAFGEALLRVARSEGVVGPGG